MNVFEEHQLFIPIINDSRFALKLRDLCEAQRPGTFERFAFDALIIIKRENKLSVQSDNAEAVRTALWEYYTNQLKEERAANTRKSVYATEGLTNPCCEIPTPTKEQNTMATNKPDTFQTKHLVNGVDVNELSDDHLIDAIKSLENQTTALQTVKTESKKILARIASLNAQREAIVALLDSRP